MKRVPGVDQNTCVTVGAERDVHSGGFVAGPFDTARTQYGHPQPGRSKHEVRLYFVPEHAAHLRGLTLTFTQFSSDVTVVTRQKVVADAEQWKFYDTYTGLESGGTWRVRAVSGVDNGCFVFTLPRR